MTNQKINIWVVDDDHYLLESYKEIINSSEQFRVSRTFRTGEEIIKALMEGEKPEVVLMDIGLPGINGVKCTEAIKEKNGDIMIIMVTAYDDNELVLASIRAGASGYITKNADYVQLINGINEIVKGGTPMSSKMARMIVESSHLNHNSPLSKRESQILHLLSNGKTYTQISEELFIARETTNTHVRNIYRKLEVNSRSAAISKATKDRLI
jgi:DNA-binding NarL/FixJ family response regulator